MELHSLNVSFFFQANRQVPVPDVDLPGIFLLDRLLDQRQQGTFPLVYSLGGPAAFIAATYSAPAK